MKDWKPQPYRRIAQELGVSDAVLRSALAASEAVVAVHPKLPPVLTLKHLSRLSGVGYMDLRRYVSREDPHTYKVFCIRKRPQPDGRIRFREICIPEHNLCDVQQWIVRHILVYGRPHSASTAFAPGAKLIDAVQPHCGSRWIIKLDVRRFFESISEISVYNVFRSLGYQPLVSFELARICTRIGSDKTWLSKTRRWRRKAPLHVAVIRNYSAKQLGYLAQGAPTSPMIANLVMRAADTEISALSESFGITYTRYADDLTFSTNSANFDRTTASALIRKVYQTLGRFGLQPNLAKTQIVSPRARKIVLGLLADGVSPRLTREFKGKLRMHLHYLEHVDVGPIRHAQRRGFSAVAGLRNHLLGLAAYAIQIEPEYGYAVKARLMAVHWPIIY